MSRLLTSIKLFNEDKCIISNLWSKYSACNNREPLVIRISLHKCQTINLYAVLGGVIPSNCVRFLVVPLYGVLKGLAIQPNLCSLDAISVLNGMATFEFTSTDVDVL